MSSCILTLQDFKRLLCQLSHQEVFTQILYAKDVEALSWHKSFHSCGKSVQLYFSPPVAIQYGIQYLLTLCVSGAIGQTILTLQQSRISLSVTVQWIALGIIYWMLFLICYEFWMIHFLIVLPIQYPAVSQILTCHCKGRWMGGNSIHSCAYPVIQTERHWLLISQCTMIVFPLL